MKKDDRSYAFIVTHTTNSRVYIRRVEVSKRWLQTVAGAALISFGVASYGLFNFVSQANNKYITENTQLRETAEKQKLELSKLNEQFKFYQRPNVDNNLLKHNSSGGEGGPGPEITVSVGANDSQGTANEPVNLDDRLKQLQSNLDIQSSIPTIWPKQGKINNEFGWRRSPFGGRSYENHTGMDIDGEKGDIVIAPGDGVVIKAGWTGGYGNLIEIAHSNGLTTRYGHLSKVEVGVGDVIQRGQLIGLVGSTGRSTGPHLHYEVRINNEPVNPRNYLPPSAPELDK
jgi:murein DD-endopeptidase MepM/ murein hydrolase activator NlpD